jgi:hypothetical protein
VWLAPDIIDAALDDRQSEPLTTATIFKLAPMAP